MILYWAVIAIKDNRDLLGVFARRWLHIHVHVAVSDLLPSLTMLPLCHVQKPSTINHHTEQGWSLKSSGSVNLFRLVLEKWVLFALFIFWSSLLNKDAGKGVISYSKLVFTVISRWTIIMNWMNNLCESFYTRPWESFRAMTGLVLYLELYLHGRCHWPRSSLTCIPFPSFSRSLSIDRIICSACEFCWEEYKQLLSQSRSKGVIFL